MCSFAAGIGVIALSSCSGGGGSSGNDLGNVSANPAANFLQQIAEPSTPFTTSDWTSSQEYLNSTGLGQLKAAEGYARRQGGLPGGKGVRIAVIDSGIDVTHPDLGNLAAYSWTAGNEAITGENHATFVAGIMGASRTQTTDPNDMHGIAYLATLVNFQAARPSTTQNNGDVTFTSNDLAQAINTASGLTDDSPAVTSDIINLSLGAYSSSDSTFASLRTAMRAAAGAGKIMVLAAGNEGLDPTRKLQPIYPASYADDVGIAGHAIVVGNLTSSNQAAASSSHCGDTKNYCLFAPGTGIRSTVNGGGYGVGSGTSFAAPYVSGAAAVVKAAFPGVSATDVVNRLLLTAADLGTVGVDSVFGRGRLDLEAAMAPVGPVGLPIGPTVEGPSLVVADSIVQLGSAFAMSAESRAFLDRAVGLDEMGFPFPLGLGGRVDTAERATGLESFIGADRAVGTGAWLPQGRLQAQITDDARTNLSGGNVHETGQDSRSSPDPELTLTFRAEPSANINMFASLSGSSTTDVGLAEALADRSMSSFGLGTFLAPFDQLAGRQSGGGLAISPAEGFDIAISAFTSVADETEPVVSLQKAEIVKTLPGDLEVRLSIGALQEEAAFLGGKATGAFGEGISSRSQFMHLSVVGALTRQIDWFGAYNRGDASISDRANGLLDSWGHVQSESFAVGLAIRDIATDGDRFSLMVGQPLRAKQADVAIDLPVGRTPEGAVVTETRKLDLAPEAREIATEFAYRLPLDRGQDHEIKAGGFVRLNPDHDPDRAPDLGLGLSYRWQF